LAGANSQGIFSVIASRYRAVKSCVAPSGARSGRAGHHEQEGPALRQHEPQRTRAAAGHRHQQCLHATIEAVGSRVVTQPLAAHRRCQFQRNKCRDDDGQRIVLDALALYVADFDGGRPRSLRTHSATARGRTDRGRGLERRAARRERQAWFVLPPPPRRAAEGGQADHGNDRVHV
jgi:hypothetical protein